MKLSRPLLTALVISSLLHIAPFIELNWREWFIEPEDEVLETSEADEVERQDAEASRPPHERLIRGLPFTDRADQEEQVHDIINKAAHPNARASLWESAQRLRLATP